MTVRACVRRTDHCLYTPLRVEPTLHSNEDGEVSNEEIVTVTDEVFSDSVKWAHITMDSGASGYIKFAYCCPLARGRRGKVA